MKCLWVTFCHAPGATTGLIWGIGEGKSKDIDCTKYTNSALICNFGVTESNLCSYFGRSCECSGNHTNPLNPESTCRYYYLLPAFQAALWLSCFLSCSLTNLTLTFQAAHLATLGPPLLWTRILRVRQMYLSHSWHCHWPVLWMWWHRLW